MKHFKGLLFFDYDGTLVDTLRGTPYPTPSTRGAIKAAQEAGYGAILATGRAMCFAPRCGIDFDGYITSNGAYVQMGGERVNFSEIEEKTLRAFSTACDDFGVELMFESQKNCFSNDLDKPHMREFLDKYEIPRDIFLPLDFKGSIQKMMVAYESEAVLEKLRAEFTTLSFRPHRSGISADVNITGVNKSVGVNALLKYTALPREASYAFGDGSNDSEMFGAVAHSAASKIHYDGLDKLSDFVTSSVESGIEDALLRFNII